LPKTITEAASAPVPTDILQSSLPKRSLLVKMAQASPAKLNAKTPYPTFFTSFPVGILTNFIFITIFYSLIIKNTQFSYKMKQLNFHLKINLIKMNKN
jgi:hypothetical protein